ncbi:Protein OS-9-like [Gracilariopsis chorda]|uniref:Protein OS-9-like n=1 Tax=Gracilariopsis chorda TaxID=448386 RepID=A0A2V3IMY6_9FLOR|nr:Protein OS-9-like [Gracilariopsis chorda]|eukprot:PXF43438.1 Protein OS-9-like [Gracilariopsis chorda]
MVRPLTLRLVVLATLCLFSKCFAVRHTFVIGDVSRRDINKPVYEIHLPRIGEFRSTNHPQEEAPHGFTAKSVVTAKGQRMSCLLPDPLPSNKPSPGTEKSDENIFDDIDDLMQVYEGKCLHRPDGWWSYEFCYGKYVAQRHIETEKGSEKRIKDEFMLGHFDKEQDRLRRKSRSEVELPDAAFTQLYTNGTLCDTTNKPRRALVKYICIDETLLHTGHAKRTDNYKYSFLGSVREVESCVYEIEFYNYAICHHSLYRKRMDRLQKPIHCSLEQGEGPFKGLSSDMYKKASLNL